MVVDTLKTLLNPMELLTNYLNPLSKDFIFTKLFSNISDIFSFFDPTGEKFIFTDFFKNISNMLSYINPFSDNFIFKDFFSNFFSWFNPLSDNFILKKLWEFLTSIISFVNPTDDNFLGKKIIELLGDLLKSLFVPSEDAINGLVNSVKDHFTFIDSINSTVDMVKGMFDNTEELPKISVNVPENKWYNGQVIVMDLNWYAPYKNYGDTIIAGFIYVFFLWRIFINLPNIISGGAGTVNDVTIASSDIEAYHKFGFGRRSSLNRRQ